jgi:hypothetical protein
MPTPFPKVTICNSVYATSQFAYNLIKQLNQLYLPSVDIFDKNLIKYLTFDQQQSLLLVYRIFNIMINLNTFPDAYRKMLVHSLDDVLVDCKFNGHACSAKDFFWRWDPVYGNCYSFNSGLDYNGKKVNFRESVLSGAVFGLKLNAYVGYFDKLESFNVGWFTGFGLNAPQYGLNILIENNTYMSDLKWNVIAINGGTANYIAVKRRFNSKLPKPYSNCEIDNTSPGEFNSQYYNLVKKSPYQYNQQLCISQCMQKKIIQYCNCTMATFLSLYNDSCESFGEALCSYAVTTDGTYQIESNARDCITECPLECNSTQFLFTSTSQTYTGMLFETLVKSNPVFASDFSSTPITEETASNKFVELNIYYDKLAYTLSEDSPSMDIVAFFGSIGGTLGLFMGLSVLSFCEMFHVVFESFFHFNRRLTHGDKRFNE